MANTVQNAKFVALLVQHQPRIYAYIRALVPDRAAADDIFQEVCVVLWEKFDSYDSEKPFLHWALGVARYAVLSFHRDRSRNRLRFTEHELDLLASEAAEECETLSDLRAALDDCLAKLPEHARKLLALRYQPDADVQEIAEQLRRPVATVYSMLKRLRVQLHGCIQRTLSQSGAGL